jgi:ribonuclease-3
MRPLNELETELDYKFSDVQFLKKALTHSSHAHEKDPVAGDNEQLEFLGDAVVGFLVSDFLYRAHPSLNEGQLSRLKGFFVS